MKYFTISKLYKASNLIFNPETMFATSYDWYHLLKKINGVTVLNSYPYSVTTRKHVRKLSQLLDSLDIKYETIDAPQGLQDLNKSLLFYKSEREHLQCKLMRARKKDLYLNKIKNIDDKLILLEKLTNGVT